MRTITCVFVILAVLAGATVRVQAQEPAEAAISQLRDQVQKLEARVADLEKAVQPVKGAMLAEARRAELRRKYEQRTTADLKIYTQQQLSTCEQLYQVSNREGDSPQVKANLEKVIAEYDKSNRAGCAALYLGQRTQGDEKVKYLTMAIEKHSDCMYGDGVQVGAYARFLLAAYYRDNGKKDAATKLFQEVRTQFPNAVNHRGGLLVDEIPE
ncbi:MAG: hypothetical protein V1873_06510 [Verrucomicrobiota bacterium]